MATTIVVRVCKGLTEHSFGKLSKGVIKIFLYVCIQAGSHLLSPGPVS